MIWGAFSANVKAELVVMEGRPNAHEYVEVLEASLLPFAEVHHGQDFIFLLDNASIQLAKVTEAWFEDINVIVLDWPAKSPDLYPIENLWGILSRQVCIQGRQFETKESLICCIKERWNEISLLTINNLVYSMQNRCTEVLQTKGCLSCIYFHPRKIYNLILC